MLSIESLCGITSQLTQMPIFRCVSALGPNGWLMITNSKNWYDNVNGSFDNSLVAPIPCTCMHVHIQDAKQIPTTKASTKHSLRYDLKTINPIQSLAHTCVITHFTVRV